MCFFNMVLTVLERHGVVEIARVIRIFRVVFFTLCAFLDSLTKNKVI